ncbi:hypothetical protein FNY66_15255 [Mediterraneibacter catenae]|uniref:Uncharacterized protein n=1 Tax=Mediterraneibacter catenae TaxID=2594882 RepID=A0A5M9HYW9_9FIRM|nr:hypothetical protein [Mediterraneibacter catenae]KAA8500115.1 hypothetical protein FNY66_15255 [Mediterraneibacter catenae]
MISIKDYAKEKGVSYEAIRQSVDRYKDELEGHVIKQGKTRYLDDVAAAILDSKRAGNPVVIVNEDKDERIAALEKENKALLQRVAALQDQLLQEKERVTLLQQEKIELLQPPEVPEEPKKWWQFWK